MPGSGPDPRASPLTLAVILSPPAEGGGVRQDQSRKEGTVTSQPQLDPASNPYPNPAASSPSGPYRINGLTWPPGQPVASIADIVRTSRKLYPAATGWRFEPAGNTLSVIAPSQAELTRWLYEHYITHDDHRITALRILMERALPVRVRG